PRPCRGPAPGGPRGCPSRTATGARRYPGAIQPRAYHAAMSFFEPPPPPPGPVFHAVAVSPPAWLGPPHNVLPGIAPVELAIARTDETVVALAGIQAYPAGFGFTLCLRLRNVSTREWPGRGIAESRAEID